MALLTLQPGRCLAPDSFSEGSYAYVLADRPVRLNGILITPSALHQTATEAGTLQFDLTPSAQVDNGVEFSYTVAMFDHLGNRISIHNIIMPDEDRVLFELVTEEFDMDDQEFVPTVCGVSQPNLLVSVEYSFTYETAMLYFRYDNETEYSPLIELLPLGTEFQVTVVAGGYGGSARVRRAILAAYPFSTPYNASEYNPGAYPMTYSNADVDAPNFVVGDTLKMIIDIVNEGELRLFIDIDNGFLPELT